MDCGDYVIIVNADKVSVSGNKLTDKKFYWHTGYPGGIKERSIKQILDSRFPERVLYQAVRRMISRGPLGRKQMSNLKIYSGSSHPHEAQTPVVLDVATMNRKNLRSARS